MRHLWLTIFTGNSKTTPVFIELRRLNEANEINLANLIKDTISRGKLTRDVFDYFCESGSFTFILDGFDEVVSDHKDELQRQILELKNLYPACTFVVSSRYEERFAGWQNFEVYESSPFDFKQVRSLIKKVPFDKAAKALFLKQLTEPFFLEHHDFLSNPLLAIMMMMTFRENMEIPKRMNIFYEQAFNTLYHWHDATKAYKREKTLDIIEFQKSFGAFSLITYLTQKYEFSKSEISALIERASKVSGVINNPDKILHDYRESVNLIKLDGLMYTFIHRSFQEYFAAYSITRLPIVKAREALKKISNRPTDNVISMAFEMNKRLVLDEYIRDLFDQTLRAGAFGAATDGAEYLERLEVKYELGISSEMEGRRRENRLRSMSISMVDPVRDFINASSRLLSPSLNRAAGAEWDLLLNHSLFMEFNKAFESTSSLVDYAAITLKSKDGKVVAESDDAHSAELTDMLTRNVHIQEALASCGQALQLAMNRWSQRWSEEFRSLEEQSKTLDEFLMS
jgi:hypothetical protein